VFMILQKLLKEIESIKAIRTLDEKLSNRQKRISVGGLAGSSGSMVIAHACKKFLRPVLVITSDTDEAFKAAEDLKSFLGDSVVNLFPAWGISPYEIRAPHTDIIGQRLQTLCNLRIAFSSDFIQPIVIVAPIEAIIQKTISKSILERNSLNLKKGQQLERDHLIVLLEKLKYQRTPMTEMLGEYSVRGGIVDLFIPTDENPVRIEFFGDEIYSIRHFSVLTQRSTRQIDSTYILP